MLLLIPIPSVKVMLFPGRRPISEFLRSPFFGCVEIGDDGIFVLGMRSDSIIIFLFFLQLNKALLHIWLYSKNE